MNNEQRGKIREVISIIENLKNSEKYKKYFPHPITSIQDEPLEKALVLLKSL